MSNPDFIPSSDRKFEAFASNFMGYADDKVASWNVPQDKFDALKLLYITFAANYKKASEPETRTPSAIVGKTDSRKAFEKAQRILIKTYITYNPDVTNADRVCLGLPIHKNTRTPVKIPTKYPAFFVDTSVLRLIKIHFYDDETLRKAKPEGVRGAEIRWAILDEPPIKENDLTQSVFDTHTPHTLVFNENHRGKTIYLCLCWENTRGQKGPWSDIQAAIIP
jgi:hypothetical protein